jgi:hypothetical protein
MQKTVLLARGNQVTEIPQKMWEQHLALVPQHSSGRLSFMSDEHHQVRNWVVQELLRRGAPVPAEAIAQAVTLSRQRVQTILDELEAQLFFVVRDGQGAVSWAYPVTAVPTPHSLTFSTGERLYGA